MMRLVFVYVISRRLRRSALNITPLLRCSSRDLRFFYLFAADFDIFRLFRHMLIIYTPRHGH